MMARCFENGFYLVERCQRALPALAGFFPQGSAMQGVLDKLLEAADKVDSLLRHSNAPASAAPWGPNLRPPAMNTRVLKLSRVRALPNGGSRTLHFKADRQTHRQRYLSFDKAIVPEFEGEEAWFLAERPPGCEWRIVRWVDTDGNPYTERLAGDA